jgi:hypothetical protein
MTEHANAIFKHALALSPLERITKESIYEYCIQIQPTFQR